MQRVAGGCLVAFARRAQGPLRLDVQPGTNVALPFLDAFEARAEQFLAAEPAGADARGGLARGQEAGLRSHPWTRQRVCHDFTFPILESDNPMRGRDCPLPPGQIASCRSPPADSSAQLAAAERGCLLGGQGLRLRVAMIEHGGKDHDRAHALDTCDLVDAVQDGLHVFHVRDANTTD